MTVHSAKVAIVGAGMSGIAAAYYLSKDHGINDVVLIDAGQPMASTSAQSGENYRNWWPHEAMVAFIDRSIDLMEEIARATNNRINLTRRGYVLATRNRDIDQLQLELQTGLGADANELLRFHSRAASATYQPPHKPDWDTAPTGVDILQNRSLIREVFPSYDPEIQTVVHIRRGGDLSGQQLGMHMLEACRSAGGRLLTGSVNSIRHLDGYTLEISTSDGPMNVAAEQVVNAAGPFAGNIAELLGVSLPLHNVLQQKIAFEDSAAAIPREMPFSIDLDRQLIDWTDEEREVLREDPELSWVAEEFPGAIHCRPDGGDRGTWVKLGWAFNDRPEVATWEPVLHDQFPELVLRGAARLNPSLKAYYGRLPRNMHHYGGWYTMTDENWPLIGPMGPPGAYMICAQSGFGTMAACAGGELCAAWIAEAERPAYADALSMARHNDAAFMDRLRNLNKGIL